ncbi:hypothetical protein PRUPE_1G212300 [Prunus persica]|uniref:Uncharacterized protein n=1 Tax=Prunus persica TaxID=3760 RepID=A0A251R239_PRUPE|nr:hypothetical protein PRUPE_1G212300 [Prunus persica]
MAESRLGLGWKPALRLCWWAQGRIRAVKACFTHSPSTPPIRTSEFVIVDLRMLQRNDPGCDIGEHIQPEGEEDDSEGTVVWRERARWAESWRGMHEARVSRAMTLASSCSGSNNICANVSL